MSFRKLAARNSPLWMFVTLLGILMALLGCSLTMGSVSIPLGDVLAILQGQAAQKASWSTIVLQFRLPKAIAAMLAGSALAVSGLQMQTLFQNPLTFSRYVSDGHSCGVFSRGFPEFRSTFWDLWILFPADLGRMDKLFNIPVIDTHI